MTDKAKLFMDGDNQAVRLPDHYRFDGDEVYIRQDPETFFDMLDKDPMPEDFLADRDQGELPDGNPLDGEDDQASDSRAIMSRIANSHEQWDEFMENLKA